MTAFSFRDRNRLLNESTEYDLLIIGGGITGAGILLDATSRGLKAAVIEMQDFAAGTSSRSTKLIHGGLRYLKNLEFKLVTEVGRERAIVYENGPHVTKSERMLLPIVKGGSMSKLAAGLGVWVYDRLAGVKKHEHRKLLSASSTLEAEPLLDKEKVTGGVLYYEYRTDDSRLTIEVLKKAVELGGVAFNYVKAEKFLYVGNKVSGVIAKDIISGKEVSFKAKIVVNATGPWVDKVIALDEPSKAGRLFVTKGVHIVVPFEKLPVNQSAYFDVGDNRMIFVIPREGKTYIGTTDTAYKDDFVNPVIEDSDKDYLIQAVNKLFKSVQLKKEDIVSGWSGLRPLVREEGKSASEISRKDEIFINKSGLISIAGGKLTGYRKMAEKITDLVINKLNKDVECKTKHLVLSGGEVGGSNGLETFVNSMVSIGFDSGLNKEDSVYITNHYGSNSKRIFQIAKEGQNEANQYAMPLRLYAQLIYAIEHESVLSPSDFFIRRASMLYFYPEQLKQHKDNVIKLMRDKLHWSSETEEMFIKDLNRQISIAIDN